MPGIIKLLAQLNDENRPAVSGIALQAVGRTVVALTAYVGMVLALLLYGPPQLVEAKTVSK
jgi:hypothetical protein